MKRKMTRREFLRWTALAAAGALAACQEAAHPTATAAPSGTPFQSGTPLPSPTPGGEATPEASATPEPQATPTPEQAYLAVARGGDPAAITQAALRSLGGIERFVKSGFDVIIKPNICTDYYPYEYGATTNPLVVATLVTLALGAGARRVRVMDYPFGGTAESAYARSGIADAVKAAGGEMEVMNPNKFRPTPIPQGNSITQWDIYQDVMNCDLLIDVPTAKDHGLARITAGCKNLLGVIERRSSIHADMAARIPDLVSAIHPGLTVVDAVRTLMQNGPTGGSLDDVKINNTVFASHDIVAADAYAATLFGLTGADIPYIAAAAERGLGVMELSSLKIEEINL